MERPVRPLHQANNLSRTHSFRNAAAPADAARLARKPSTHHASATEYAKLARRPSYHGMAPHDQQKVAGAGKYSQRIVSRMDSPNLVKAPSFRVTSAMDSSQLRRQPSHRIPRKKDEPVLVQTQETSSISRQTSYYSGTASEQEKRDRRRKQNSENSRRSRLRKRLEQEKLEEAYGANEERIRYLEQVADELSSELRRFDTASREKDRMTRAMFSGEERPSWFGASFWLV